MYYQQLINKLSSNKCKLTPQRKEILKILVRAKTHLSAREIYERLCRKNSGISFDTVYRNLAILTSLHIVNQLDFHDGCSRYELIRDEEHHHHMICLKCGGAWEIPACPMEHSELKNSLPESFQVVKHRFEVFGYCKPCSEVIKGS